MTFISSFTTNQIRTIHHHHHHHHLIKNHSHRSFSSNLHHLNNMSNSSPSKPKITFESQSSLPSLPVPDLQSTATKYFHSILPIVSSQSPDSQTASDSNPTPQYNQTKSALKEFLTSPLVKELQSRLVARSKDPSLQSWLIDWWNDLAYMAYRDPLIPFSSYYIAHLQTPQSKSQDGPTRASNLIRAMLFFRDLILTEQLPPEKTRNGPLCMHSYKWLFNTVRYPNKPSDTAKQFDPYQNQHIAVIRKGRFFEFDLVKPDGQWLSAKEIETQLRKVIQSAGDQETPDPVGALTSEHRDTWTDARSELIKDSPQNIKSLERIESAIVCVALDDTSPITRDELGWNIWSGDGKNRFFDKQQLIVCENGQSGFNAEHSCMDGTPVATMNDWILSRLENKSIDLGSTSDSNLPSPKPITFDLSTRTKQNVSKAIENHQKLMSAQTLDVLQYVGFGKQTIKKYFKASPDAIAQLTLQLGHYKLFGSVPVTYESAQTRKFKMGRTEVIRACSIEALEWCKAMVNVNMDQETRVKKFREAEKAHVRYANWASNGEGVDRHLLGLRLLLKPGEEMPTLFQDETYKKSTTWTFSTSTLPSEYFNGLGYGPVVPEGYGIAYAVNDQSMRFTITTTTGTGSRLKESLQEAAEDIKALLMNDTPLVGSSKL